MALRDQLLDRLQEATGLAVLPKDELDRLNESMVDYQYLRDESEDLAYRALNYFGGRPQELRPERRQRLAQKGRVAWMEDPVAGTESEHYANFALGRGVSKPLAKDPDVQAVIDEAWSDASNFQHLTSLDALRAISNELRAGCNVFPIIYPGAGVIKVGFLDADTVTDIVASDDDRQLPLYYLTRTITRNWDYTTNQLSAKVGVAEVKYYAHWSNVEDLASYNKANGKAAPSSPPADKLGDGLVYHMRMNRLLEQQFGTPLGARQLRFFCHDDTTEALTSEGWLGLPELQRRYKDGSLPLVAGVKDGATVFERPQSMFVGRYEGDLLHFKTARGLDMMVTPNHRMLVTDRGGDDFRFVEAKDVQHKRMEVMVAPPVVGERPRVETFTLPGLRARDMYDTPRIREANERRLLIRAEYASGATREELAERYTMTPGTIKSYTVGKGIKRHRGSEFLPEKTIPMDTWLSWLGWWISEGDTRCGLTQESSSESLGDVQKACRDMVLAGVDGIEGIRGTPEKHTWCWRPKNPRQILRWLEENAGSGSYNKRLPAWVFDLPYEQMMLLLRALMGGDGTPTNWESDGWGRYYTVSEQLANDVQRLATLCGFRTKLDWKTHPTWSYEKGGIYWVNISATTRRMLPKPTPVSYDGDVWCFALPCGTMITRRNNVVGVSGNSALNRLLESRVSMAQAASSIIAKRVIKGGPQDVLKAAHSVLSQTGEIGAAQTPRQALSGMKPPTRAGSTSIENESSNLQAFTLNSGAAQAAQDIQMVRGQAISPSALGQHYFGDQSTTSLSTAATLELPAMAAVGAYQEVFEQLLRWFTDMAIQEAVRSGRLGGNLTDGDTSGKDLTELRLTEADDKATAEKRTGKDLSYSFQMPYPGRRDVDAATTAFGAMMLQISPQGENEPLLKAMLNWVFTNGFEFENAAQLADEVAKAQADLLAQQQEQEQLAQQQQLDLQQQAQAATIAAQGGSSASGTGGSQAKYGAKMNGATGTNGQGQSVQEAWLPPGLDVELADLIGEIEATATQALLLPVTQAAVSLNGAH